MESILKNEVEAAPDRNKQHLLSHNSTYNHHMVPIDNEMTTPKIFHDVTTPTENLAGFIIKAIF